MIDNLGAELVNCRDGCSGIWHDQVIGVIPRSLFLERPAATARGCLAVGLNPSRSSESERRFYRDVELTYDRVREYRLKGYCGHRLINDIPYFGRTRTVIEQLGLHGPILWSNLAKCENQKDRKDLPPIQTLRHCTQRFLKRELDVCPPEWIVLGIGWEAFRTVAYLVPERGVIGIPHPTGGFRDFRKLLSNGILLEDLKKRALHAMRLNEPEAVWLGGGKEGAEQSAARGLAPTSLPPAGERPCSAASTDPSRNSHWNITIHYPPIRTDSK